MCEPHTPGFLNLLQQPGHESLERDEPTPLPGRPLPHPSDRPDEAGHLSAPCSSRRRRLWELARDNLCPLLGTCVPLDLLRRLLGRACRGDDLPETDYALHCRAIAESTRRGPFAELLQRELERRHALAVQQVRPCRDSTELAAHWQRSVQRGEITGPLWAILTHPRCDAALEERLRQDVHMLQHQIGAGVRADVQRLDALQRENAVLARELASIQQRVTLQMREKTRLIDQQQQELLRLRALLIVRDTRLECLQEELQQWHDRIPDLDTRLALEHRCAAQQQRIAQLQQQLQLQQVRARARSAEPQSVPPASPLATPPVASGPDGIVATDLHDKAVLCVGGRTASVPVYRRLVEHRGARFLHHDGGPEDSPAQLDAHLAAADLVICQTGCISHGAYWRVKEHCKRTGKRCVFLERPSVSSLARSLGPIAPGAPAPD